MPDESDSPPVATTAVVVRDERPTRQPAVWSWDAQYQKLVMETVLKPKKRKATVYELGMFAEQVARTGLDPFFNQIYGIYRYDSRVGGEVMKVQAAIDGFRLMAERTGKYEGQAPQEWCDEQGVWTDVWLKDEPPYAARCGVYKTGRRDATYAVAHWSEYVVMKDGKPDGMWRTMPANQLSKCAEALALRKAFPAELSGIYTVDEMAQADTPRSGGEDVTAGVSGGGDAEGVWLPDEVEAVLARAAALGHAGIANRAAAEWAVYVVRPLADGRNERVVDEKRAARWAEQRMRELDRFEERQAEAEPPDAEVVVEPESVASDEELALAREMRPEAFAEGGSREQRASALMVARTHLAAEDASMEADTDLVAQEALDL